MDELEIRMREVLLQLALTSNGSTASWDSSGGSEPDYVLVDKSGNARLTPGDAPQLLFARLWDEAEDDQRRAEIVEQAKARLDEILISRGDRTVVESEKSLFARIVDQGEGVAAQELATRMRCGVTLVRRAREVAGRETDYGRAPRNGRELPPDERRAEVVRLRTEEDMSRRQIARALQLSESTVRRDLGERDY